MDRIKSAYEMAMERFSKRKKYPGRRLTEWNMSLWATPPQLLF